MADQLTLAQQGALRVEQAERIDLGYYSREYLAIQDKIYSARSKRENGEVLNHDELIASNLLTKPEIDNFNQLINDEMNYASRKISIRSEYQFQTEPEVFIKRIQDAKNTVIDDAVAFFGNFVAGLSTDHLIPTKHAKAMILPSLKAFLSTFEREFDNYALGLKNPELKKQSKTKVAKLPKEIGALGEDL